METKHARQESGCPYCLAFICFSPLQNDPHSASGVFLKHTPSCGSSMLLGETLKAPLFGLIYRNNVPALRSTAVAFTWLLFTHN